jgi:hypothetical protein
MNRVLTVSAFLAVAVAVPAAHAGIIDSLWIGPSGGAWHSAGNWDPAVVPNNAGKDLYHAIIDFKSAGQVNLSPSDATISALTIGSQTTLSLANGRTLFFEGDGSRSGSAAGVIDNRGMLLIASTGSITALRIVGGNGPITLTGGGTVQLIAGNSQIRGINAGSLINVNNAIHGRGNISTTSATTALGSLTNLAAGLIVADSSAGPLLINASITPITNEGILRAENGGNLQLNVGAYDNTGGVIEALVGSQVTLSGNAIITGGEVRTEDDGLVRVTSGSPRLIDANVLGRVHINNSNDLDMIDVVADGSTITLASTGSITTLRPVGGTLTLTGDGEVVMSNATTNRIRSTSSAGGSLVNVNNTIRGAGEISSTSSTTRLDSVTNHADGLILANFSNSLTIHGTNFGFTNEGALRAADGGTLILTAGPLVNSGTIEAATDSEVGINGAVIDNDGGLIVAEGPGSQLTLGGNAVITGGELHTLDGGVARVTSGSPRLVETEVSGDFIVNNGNDLDLVGAVMVGETNITLNSTGSITTLRPAGGKALTLVGGGTLAMSNNANNRIRTPSGESGSLVNIDCTIRGSGDISSSSSTTWLSEIVNHGWIVADQPTPLDVFGLGGPITNTGVMRAENGATLILNAGSYDNTDGLIEALAGSTVRLAGSTIITGGELAVEEDGVIRVTSSTPHLIDLTNAGLLHLNNSTRVELSGTIENTGTITVNSTGSVTGLDVEDGPVFLSGGGEVVMSNASNNRKRRSGSGALVNVNNTIRGAGDLSSSSGTTWLDIVNQGAILADGTVALSIFGNSPNGFVNDAGGVVEVTGTGGLTSTGAGGGFTNAGQIIINEARSMSRTGDLVQIGGETRVNGTLTVSSGSFLLQGGSLTGHGAVNGAVSNIGGSVEPGGSIGTLTVDSYSQSGTGRLRVEIAGLTPGSDHDQLVVTGTASLGGRLEATFDDSFKPMVGDEFTVVSAGTRTGGFAIVSPCENIRVVYTDNDAIIEYTGVMKHGDFNCDGVVDVLDLLLLLDNWGSCANCDDCPIDLNEDCSVDVLDLLTLLDNWG